MNIKKKKNWKKKIFKNLNNCSKVIIKYQNLFKKKTIFFGNIQNILPIFLKINFLIILIKKYNFLKYIKYIIEKNLIYFSIRKYIFKLCKNIVFFWSKNKKESLSNIIEIIQLLPLNYNIYIIGENKSSIKTAEKNLNNFIKFNKIIKIKHCIFLQGKIKIINKYKIFKKFKINTINIKKKKIKIYSLPGLFNFKANYTGNKLLNSTFNKNVTGKILDLGCGEGILGIYLLINNKNIHITFTDICFNSLITTKKNLKKNKIKNKNYEILLSNIFLNIKKKYNLIICNPPIHNNLKINIKFLKNLLKNYKIFLKKNGKIKIVINSFISKKIIKKIQNKFLICKKNKNFLIYKFIK